MSIGCVPCKKYWTCKLPKETTRENCGQFEPKNGKEEVGEEEEKEDE